jgi:hypothetical protein
VRTGHRFCTPVPVKNTGTNWKDISQHRLTSGASSSRAGLEPSLSGPALLSWLTTVLSWLTMVAETVTGRADGLPYLVEQAKGPYESMASCQSIRPASSAGLSAWTENAAELLW